nr:DUF2935 domain-containing protein [Haloplasma contractile]
MPLIDLLDLWIQDQVGHAVLLYNVLDPVEIKIRTMVDSIITILRGYILQIRKFKITGNYSPSIELRIKRLAVQVFEEIMKFYQLVENTIALYKSDELLSRTTLRFLEHHIPETCYFLNKLSEYAGEIKPQIEDCPLSKPSFNI